MQTQKNPRDPDLKLRELANIVYNSPQLTIDQLILMIGVSKSLILVLPYRLMDLSDDGRGFLLALLLIMVNLHVCNYLVKWLQEIAELVKVEPTKLMFTTYFSLSVALILHMMELSGMPLVSTIVDFGVFLTVWTGVALYVLMYACEKCPPKPQNEDATVARETTSPDEANDGSQDG